MTTQDIRTMTDDDAAHDALILPYTELAELRYRAMVYRAQVMGWAKNPWLDKWYPSKKGRA